MPLLRQNWSNQRLVHARAEMSLMFIVAAITIGFYLRFLWAITKELKHLRKKRLTFPTGQPVVHRNLIRVDPSDLCARTLDRYSSRIKDKF
jgi:hypothetical protein